MNPDKFILHKTPVAMDDGRTLNYYDFAPAGAAPPYLAQHQQAAVQHPPGGHRVLPHASEMRWNPALAEWVVYAAHRMNRPQLPSRDACPLCPGVLELPLPYQVAIFENRAPALSYVPGDPTLPATGDAFELTAPGRGRCDIVVYAQQHDARLARMPVNDIYGLIEAWRDRYRQLAALPEVRCVNICENKGRDAGMTLDHPHGQIFAFPFLPPLVERQLAQSQLFAGAGGLWTKIIAKETQERVRIIAETEAFLAAQPFYARYPYEVHIWARRPGVASLLEMTAAERRQLAGIYKNVIARYENLWPQAAYGFPTLMVMHQLSNVPGVENYRFHVEFYPLQRSPDKLKYRASIESGTGTFLNDALPETQAAELRAALPHEVELPSIIYED